MSWHYRSPTAFPAIFFTALREAAAQPEMELILGAATDRKNIEVLAEKFRWFRWCVRERKEVADLAAILENYDIRTKIKEDVVGYILFVSARSTKVSEFIRLNPALADEIISDCQ